MKTFLLLAITITIGFAFTGKAEEDAAVRDILEPMAVMDLAKQWQDDIKQCQTTLKNLNDLLFFSSAYYVMTSERLIRTKDDDPRLPDLQTEAKTAHDNYVALCNWKERIEKRIATDQGKLNSAPGGLGGIPVGDKKNSGNDSRDAAKDAGGDARQAATDAARTGTESVRGTMKCPDGR